MNKVMVFLEKYVQWVALALGLGWIGLMGYTYWATPVITRSVPTPAGAKEFGPGEIDRDLADSKVNSPLQQLRDAMDAKSGANHVKAASAPTTRFVDTYVQKLQGGDGVVIAAIIPETGGSIITGPTMPNENPTGLKGDLPQAEIDKRPILTNIIGTDLNGNPIPAVLGRSQVQTPDPSTLQNPLADPAAAGATAVAVPAAPAAPALPIQKEIDWCDVSCTMHMPLLAEAFASANIPQAARITQFLRVDLIREEQVNGQWGNEVVIQSLGNRIIPPLPGKGDKLAEDQFLKWSAKSVEEIIHPPFYPVVGGDQFRTASMPPVANVGNGQGIPAALPFDPANPPVDRPMTREETLLRNQWLTQQKMLKAKELQKQKALQQQQSKPPAAPSGTTGRPSVIPADDEPIVVAEVTVPPPENVRHGAPGTHRPAPTFVPSPGVPQPMAPQPQPGFVPAGPAVLPAAGPAGPFVPAQTTDVEIFAHDETVEPGKTYRYKMRVYIKNPLYNTLNMAKQNSDTDILALTIDSPWTNLVVVPSKYFYFLTNVNALGVRSSAKIDYWTWDKGTWRVKPLSVQPGDSVGDTDWVVSDLRLDPQSRNGWAYLVNSQGLLSVRNVNSDAKDKDKLRLEGPVKAAGPITPVMPGGLPGPSGEGISGRPSGLR